MIAKRVVFLSLTIITFASCERTINYDFEEAPKMLAVYCFFSPDSIWKAEVYKLSNIENSLDTISNFHIKNAEVKIFKNNNLEQTLTYIGNGVYAGNENIKPEFGSLYKIEVIADGYPTVSSENIEIPPKPSIELIEYDTTPEYGLFFSNPSDVDYATEAKNYSYRIKAKDAYLLKIYSRYKFIYYHCWFSKSDYEKYEQDKYQYINCISMYGITDYINYISRVDNSGYGCKDYSEIADCDSVTLYGYNRHEEYVEFLLSSDKQQDEQNGDISVFFANTDIYSNLKGGVGIFTSYSSLDSIKIPISVPDEEFFSFDCP